MGGGVETSNHGSRETSTNWLEIQYIMEKNNFEFHLAKIQVLSKPGVIFFDRPGGKILLLTSIFDARNIQHKHFIKNFKSPSQLEREF